MRGELAISIEDPGSADAIRLVAALLDELEPLYRNLWSNPFDPNELRVARSCFVVGRIDGEAIACGGIRPLDELVAEVRRMYVAPSSRSHGVAGAILGRLEEEARRRGFSWARLETGVLQPAAIRLYERTGYTRIPPYGVHEGDPLSVCFEKRVDPKLAT